MRQLAGAPTVFRHYAFGGAELVYSLPGAYPDARLVLKKAMNGGLPKVLKIVVGGIGNNAFFHCVNKRQAFQLGSYPDAAGPGVRQKGTGSVMNVLAGGAGGIKSSFFSGNRVIAMHHITVIAKPEPALIVPGSCHPGGKVQFG